MNGDLSYEFMHKYNYCISKARSLLKHENSKQFHLEDLLEFFRSESLLFLWLGDISQSTIRMTIITQAFSN